MERWSQHLYKKEAIEKGYNEDYINALLRQGKLIQTKHNSIPVIYSLAHLAHLSKTLYLDLHTIVTRHQDKNYPYKSFPIKKHSGGYRWISIPIPPLMAVQNFINKEILSRIHPHHAACAYVPGIKAPLKYHVEKHCTAEWILKIDLENFFDNISEYQVFDFFSSLNYPKLLCFEMARLCTKITPGRKGKRWHKTSDNYNIESYSSNYVGSLPQGAPTSPALSNLICRQMDEQLELLALKYDCNYSRYADDLCFSFSNSNRDQILKFKKLLMHILWKNGFTENKKKTRIIPPGACKKIVGLNINESYPTIPKELRDRVRMHLYYAKKFGIPEHCRKKGFRSVIGFRNHLYGLITYILSINENQGKGFLEEYKTLPWLDFDI